MATKKRSALGPNALVIVESPTKAKTIRGFLPEGFTVAASMGHVRDLPRKAAEIPAKYKDQKWAKFGVNVEQGFEPLYIITPDKKGTIRELKELLADALMASRVISWNTIRLTGTLGLSTSSRCHEMLSPSRSSSVAR